MGRVDVKIWRYSSILDWKANDRSKLCIDFIKQKVIYAALKNPVKVEEDEEKNEGEGDEKGGHKKEKMRSMDK